MKKISDKRKAELPAYNKLVRKLRELCGNKSEISGDPPDWRTSYKIEAHHIQGRLGKLFTDPFNIICLTRKEHEIEMRLYKDIPALGTEYLLELVKGIRIQQGFEEGK